MLSLNKSNDKTVASNDNLNNSSADDDGTASAIGHSDPNPKNDHNSVETISSKLVRKNHEIAKKAPAVPELSSHSGLQNYFEDRPTDRQTDPAIEAPSRSLKIAILKFK